MCDLTEACDLWGLHVIAFTVEPVGNGVRDRDVRGGGADGRRGKAAWMSGGAWWARRKRGAVGTGVR